MSSEGVAARAVTLRRHQESDPGLQLIRKDTLPVVAAVLGEHLGGQQRVLTAAEFLESLREDLSALRDQGFDLPKSAQEYLADWVSAKLIVRHPGQGREELVELSPAALAAIRFVAEVEDPHSSVTSSRLANVAGLLSELARDTDPNPASHLEALLREQEELERAIAEVSAGNYESINDAEAIERLTEIIRLAGSVPGDFARVREELERVNQDLREQIIRQTGSRGDILDQVFDGFDDIDQSEAGRSFVAFYNLVLDPERANAFDASVDTVLSRDFATVLSDEEIVFLRRWLSRLQAESSQVRDVMTSLARSLRRFVESQAFREHRRVADALDQAKETLLEASRTLRPQEQTGYELAASSISISSISSWNLYDPSDTRVSRPVKYLDEAPLDIERLREQVRLSEVDFNELRGDVAEVLDHQQVASIAEVLKRHPATQGLASIIGLLVLSDAMGMSASGTEVLQWETKDGQLRRVEATRRIFDRASGSDGDRRMT
ncbi:MAG: DUF3375 domain-containing protein [Coriobacteriia bacterium]|nr:DUF3375 domain-containing protein [Coriobacteriia bacterium]